MNFDIVPLLIPIAGPSLVSPEASGSFRELQRLGGEEGNQPKTPLEY